MVRGIISRSTHIIITDLLYIVNVFKIQLEINRKMTAEWAISGYICSAGFLSQAFFLSCASRKRSHYTRELLIPRRRAFVIEPCSFTYLLNAGHITYQTYRFVPRPHTRHSCGGGGLHHRYRSLHSKTAVSHS